MSETIKNFFSNKLLESVYERHENVVDYKLLFDMRLMLLINRILSLFKWHGLPFPQHELDLRAIIDGYAGVVNDEKRKIMTAWGGLSGPTQYTDIFKDFTYAAPTARGGTKRIGKECVILKNTSLKLSMTSWLYRYADLFAHNDLSLRMALINSRYQDILKTTDSAKAEQITDWYNGLYNGRLLAIVDETPLSDFLGDTTGSISAIDLTAKRDIDFTRYTELENELTRSFYRELGIRWNKDKKANLVAGEVEQDNMLLMFNVSNMLESRREFCEDYKTVFGDDVSVELTIPIESEDSRYDETDDRGLSDDDVQ